MIKTFSNLSLDAQLVIMERFAYYGIDGAYAFDYSDIFSDQVKSLSSNDIIEFMEYKDLSHIYPSSMFPYLKNDINNIFLEDSSINRARGALIVSPAEQQAAWIDQIHDTMDLDVNEDGIIDLSGIDFDLHSYNEFWDTTYFDITFFTDGFF